MISALLLNRMFGYFDNIINQNISSIQERERQLHLRVMFIDVFSNKGMKNLFDVLFHFQLLEC